jgi:hypothetical protein
MPLLMHEKGGKSSMKKVAIILAVCLFVVISMSDSYGCGWHDRIRCNFDNMPVLTPMMAENTPLIWIQGVQLMVVYRGEWHTEWLNTDQETVDNYDISITDVILPWDTRQKFETLTDDFHIILNGKCLRVVDTRWQGR